MTDCTVAAPVRATKAPPRAKAAPANASEVTPAQAAPEPITITEDEALVATTLAEQLMAIYTTHGFVMRPACAELLHAAVDGLEKAHEGYEAIYKAAALVCGAIAVERADRSDSPAIAPLEVVHQSLNAASISYDFESAACEMMAEGIRAGQRQFRDRPSPPIRRVEADSEDIGRSALTRKQLLCVLEVAANNLSTINNLLMLAQEEPEAFAVAGLIDAAQALTRHCGGMVDTAAGEAILGGHDRWNFGPNFADLGKGGAA